MLRSSLHVQTTLVFNVLQSSHLPTSITLCSTTRLSGARCALTRVERAGLAACTGHNPDDPADHLPHRLRRYPHDRAGHEKPGPWSFSPMWIGAPAAWRDALHICDTAALLGPRIRPGMQYGAKTTASGPWLAAGTSRNALPCY